MATVTWQDLVDRARRRKGYSPLLENLEEYKKGFRYYIKNFGSRYKDASKEKAVDRIADLINQNLKRNN